MAKKFGERVVLAFDYGTGSIGVAVGNEVTFTVSCLKAIKANDGIPDARELEQRFLDWNPDAIVVGLPLNMDGTFQEVTYRARKFGNRLGDKYKLPVFFKDERLTTKSAREQLFAEGGYRNLSKGAIDSRSAQVILEGFWEEQELKGEE